MYRSGALEASADVVKVSGCQQVIHHGARHEHRHFVGRVHDVELEILNQQAQVRQPVFDVFPALRAPPRSRSVQ